MNGYCQYFNAPHAFMSNYCDVNRYTFCKTVLRIAGLPFGKTLRPYLDLRTYSGKKIKRRKNKEEKK